MKGWPRLSPLLNAVSCKSCWNPSGYSATTAAAIRCRNAAFSTMANSFRSVRAAPESPWGRPAHSWPPRLKSRFRSDFPFFSWQLWAPTGVCRHFGSVNPQTPADSSPVSAGASVYFRSIGLLRLKRSLFSAAYETAICLN